MCEPRFETSTREQLAVRSAEVTVQHTAAT